MSQSFWDEQIIEMILAGLDEYIFPVIYWCKARFVIMWTGTVLLPGRYERI